jgi:hypothetical protein
LGGGAAGSVAEGVAAGCGGDGGGGEQVGAEGGGGDGGQYRAAGLKPHLAVGGVCADAGGVSVREGDGVDVGGGADGDAELVEQCAEGGDELCGAADDDGQSGGVGGGGEDRDHEAVGGVVVGEPGVQEPRRPEVVEFVAVELSAAPGRPTSGQVAGVGLEFYGAGGGRVRPRA